MLHPFHFLSMAATPGIRDGDDVSKFFMFDLRLGTTDATEHEKVCKERERERRRESEREREREKEKEKERQMERKRKRERVCVCMWRVSVRNLIHIGLQ